MNVKPFIVLCFLFGLFLISAVATEPHKDETPADEATKNVDESKIVCGVCCSRGLCRRCCVTAVEATEDTNNVDETKRVCGICCGVRQGCRRCCGKASEVPPNVEFKPQTLEAVEVKNIDGSKASCGLCCSPVRNACKPCCHKLGEIPATVLFNPQNAIVAEESKTESVEEHRYGHGGGGGYCKRRCCGHRSCWCC